MPNPDVVLGPPNRGGVFRKLFDHMSRARAGRLRLGLLLLSAALLVSGCVLALPGGWAGIAGLIGAVVALALAGCNLGGSGGGGGKKVGFVITGASNNDYAGFSVSWAGDVNGDGTGDLVIGASGAGSGGEAYLVFGRDSEDGVNIGGLASADGVTLVGGTASSGFDAFYSVKVGTAVSWAGDLNNDGVDDVAVGDADFEIVPDGTIYSGAAFVIFGDGALSGDVNLAELAASPGTDGFAVLTYDYNDYQNTGTSLSGIGDINGDGRDDLLVGSPGDSASANAGLATVVFGRNSFSANRLVEDLYNPGTQGFAVGPCGEGCAADEVGSSVALAGDLDDDGNPDIVVGAAQAYYYEGTLGVAYVLFGDQSSLANTFNEASYSGFRIGGVDDAGIGHHVAPAGDLNGDGKADILVGAENLNGNDGGAYVIFGGRNDNQHVDVSSMGSGAGFRIAGAPTDSYAGSAGMGVGDVNGDGIDDLLLGAHYANGGGGAVFLIFGKSGSGGPGNVNLGNMTASQGLRFDSPDAGGHFGYAIDASGDVNGDGVTDILISAPGANSNRGKVYVIFGGNLSNFEDLLGN